MNKERKLGSRRWAAIILIGLFGQIAWAIENNYINLWVFSQSHDAAHITWMTMASAVVATLTTFFIGALSDKLGKRKVFIAAGYTIWGLTVFAFGLMSLTNMASLAGGDIAKGIILVGVMNVVVDCVMTLFGSTANDAAFNAYVTDETNEKNRPVVESVLSVMPLFAMAIMLGVGLILGIPGEQGDMTNETWANKIAGPWFIFFLIFGIATTAVGILSFFLLPKDHIQPNREDHYFKHMVKGFAPKTVKSNPLFYIALLTFMLFNIAVDSFMPYILVYVQGLKELNASLGFMGAMAIIFGVAAAAVLVIGANLKKLGAMRVLFPSIGVMFLGALAFFLVGDSALGVVLAGIALMSGYLCGTTVLGAKIRDLTPEEDVGALQSVRMVFVVMIPMIAGSNLSLLFFGTSDVIDPSTGSKTRTPNKWMFLVTMIACALTLIPAIWLAIADKKTNKLASVHTDEK
ncbi:MAG: MFS transporter [Bacilli bacterium]|nr:MFS transporter [Bacilli bacterium]